MEDGFKDFWKLKDYFLKNRHLGFRIKGKCEECGSKLAESGDNTIQQDEDEDVKKKSDWVIKQRKYGRNGKLKTT